MRKNKLGQIWVETVIYTLIFLVLIGVVLAFVTPAIQKQKDKTTIQRTIDGLIEIDNGILDVKRAGPSNIRQVSLLISKGTLTIDGVNGKITFEILESAHKFSEVGKRVAYSDNLEVKTTDNGKNFDVLMTLKYDLTEVLLKDTGGVQTSRTFSKAQTPYQIMIENAGRATVDDPIDIKIYEV